MKETNLMRRVPMSVKSAKNEDGTYRFTITTARKDRVGDVVVPTGGQFGEWLRGGGVVLYGHNYGELPVGRAERIRIKSDAVEADVRFASEIDPFAARVERFVAGDFLRSCSIGFKPLSNERQSDGSYLISQWEMLELSMVPVPANSDAIVAAKGVGMVGVGIAKPPDEYRREDVKAWAKAHQATVEVDSVVDLGVVQGQAAVAVIEDAAPAWAKALAADMARIKSALGLTDDEQNNGIEPTAEADDLLDPDEVDDSPDLTEALAALDVARLGA